MSNFLQASGWSVQPAGEHAIRAISPMTLGLDGQHAAFSSSIPTPTRSYLTDACETALHAATFGIELVAKRLEVPEQTPASAWPASTRPAPSWRKAPTSSCRTPCGTPSKLAMALSFQCAKWMPKFSRLRFRAQVGRTLAEARRREPHGQGRQRRREAADTADFAFAVRSATSTS